ncbi:hypothetical protein RI138_10115 [Streptomyces sp. C11-1]|uniref:Uncharacterized protein n=1 Tax=Streptomyces durocortorensis TaxID=2811104 RepID=A0ABY9W1K5_9ACTN|nr:hypothetical protein [Streptomyces durocortorensis]WNF27166.1 hypothetical protein RI138_10115 [Streptomyces durocortorensis]
MAYVPRAAVDDPVEGGQVFGVDAPFESAPDVSEDQVGVPARPLGQPGAQLPQLHALLRHGKAGGRQQGPQSPPSRQPIGVQAVELLVAAVLQLTGRSTARMPTRVLAGAARVVQGRRRPDEVGVDDPGQPLTGVGLQRVHGHPAPGPGPP